MTFTCIDADYQSSSLPEGGMLYLADQKVERGFFGGYAPACMKTARSGDISAMAFRMDVPWEKPGRNFGSWMQRDRLRHEPVKGGVWEIPETDSGRRLFPKG